MFTGQVLWRPYTWHQEEVPLVPEGLLWRLPHSVHLCGTLHLPGLHNQCNHLWGPSRGCHRQLPGTAHTFLLDTEHDSLFKFACHLLFWNILQARLWPSFIYSCLLFCPSLSHLVSLSLSLFNSLSGCDGEFFGHRSCRNGILFV